MTNSTLSKATLNHYEELIGRIGDEYIDYRWKRHPVSRSHYRQTQRSVEFAFYLLGGAVDHILEVGCGPGTWTDICLRNAKKMTIVDISNEMLKLVRDRFRKTPIDFICGDFISKAVELQDRFDVIFSARAVEYMDNKAAMVAKSANLLKPGGHLVIITKNPGWMDKKRNLRSSGKEPSGDIHADWIGWREMEKLYRSEGLTKVSSFPVCIGSYYSPLKYWMGIKLCYLIQDFVYRQKMNPRIDFLSESYLTIGQKPL